MPWQFWLDVGGTFTDCLARAPDRRLLRRKVLSSWITKGRAAAGSSSGRMVDAARNEPAGFWTDYRLYLLDGKGGAIAEFRVLGSESSGRLRIQQQSGVGSQESERERNALDVIGLSYELISPE